MSMDEKQKAALAGCLLGIVALTVGPLIHGVVIAQLWHWFMVPTFGLPALGVAQSIGLGLVVTTLRPSQMRAEPKEEDVWAPVVRLFAGVVLVPALTIGIGFVVSRFL